MLAGFVLESISAPGTAATINLGVAAAGRRRFRDAYATGSLVFYFLDDGTQAEWGYGTLTIATPDTLTRTVLGNTAGTTLKLNFTGTTRVYNMLPAERAVYRDQNSNVALPAALSVAGASTLATAVLPSSGANWSGNLRFACQATGAPNTWAVGAYGSGTATGALLVRVDVTGISLAGFYFGASVVGGITTNGTAVAYNTTSDYRLKITYGRADGSCLLSVPVHDAAWRALPGQRQPMCLAHEVAAAAPWAVTGERDAVDEHGNIVPQMVDYAKLVPALLALVQELAARLAALEAR